MPYIKRTVEAGPIIEHRKMQLSRMKITGVTLERAANRGKTTEAQAEANERKAEDRLRWKLNANFTKGDYHAVLHYRSKPQDFLKILEDGEKFTALLQQECRKRKIRIKYVAVMETKSMTRPHHHVVLTRIPDELIAEVWKQVVPDGHISFVPLDDRGNHEKLASYLIKESRATLQRIKELTGKRGKRYRCSQNLVTPVPKYERVPASSWRDEPKPKKGFTLYKFDEGGTTQSGVTDTGYPWQLYYEVKRE